jgi:transposase-like protein
MVENLSKANFKNLYELRAFFNTEEKCRKYLAEAIWPNGEPVCPHCGNTKCYKFSNGIHYKCAKCRKKFTVVMKTVFEKGKVPLSKWFMALYLMACHKKGISSLQLASDIGVAKGTAWFMLHRLRVIYTQADEPATKLEGIIYTDECFIGGINKWRHWDKKVKNSQGRSFKDKTPVQGMLQADGDLRAMVTATTNKEDIQPNLKKNIEPGSTLITDDWYAYNGMDDFNRESVDHSKRQYVSPAGITTNPVESSWACLKGSLRINHNNVSKKHLQKYVDAFVFRFNTRRWDNDERVHKTLADSYGKRLTYRNLVA